MVLDESIDPHEQLRSAATSGLGAPDTRKGADMRPREVRDPRSECPAETKRLRYDLLWSHGPPRNSVAQRHIGDALGFLSLKARPVDPLQQTLFVARWLNR